MKVPMSELKEGDVAYMIPTGSYSFYYHSISLSPWMRNNGSWDFPNKMLGTMMLGTIDRPNGWESCSLVVIKLKCR
jgi:hypothetical protein